MSFVLLSSYRCIHTKSKTDKSQGYVCNRLPVGVLQSQRNAFCLLLTIDIVTAYKQKKEKSQRNHLLLSQVMSFNSAVKFPFVSLSPFSIFNDFSLINYFEPPSFSITTPHLLPPIIWVIRSLVICNPIIPTSCLAWTLSITRFMHFPRSYSLEGYYGRS